MKIANICDVRIGHAFRGRLVNEPRGEICVIQPKDICDDGLISFSSDLLKTSKSVTRPLQKGDVLVVNRGRFVATVFNCADGGVWTAPSSVIVLSEMASSVLPEYLALYFNSIDGQRMFRSHSEHTTVPFISAGNLADMDIPVPPLDRQRVLVAYERTMREYSRKSQRKQELQRIILNNELRVKD